MAYLGEWIKHIVLIILVATFLDLLLPNTQMRRYIQLVVGLIIIVLILSPILELLQVDPERFTVGIEQLLEPDEEPQLQFEDRKEAVQEVQDRAVLEEVKRLWAQEIKREVEREFALNVEEIDIDLVVVDGQADVNQVKLVVARSDDGAERAPHGEGALVEPVVIAVDLEKEEPDQIDALTREEEKWNEKLLTYFDQNWNISGDKIEIFWTGG